MQVSVETTQGLERRLTISVEAAKVDSEVTKRLRQLSKTQRIDGFRPGKVPVSVIQKRYGQAVRQEVAGELMQHNYFEAIMAEKLNPAGMPQFAPTKLAAGEDFEFTATFEVYPEVTVEGLDKVKVEKPVVEVTDADLEEMLVTLQKQHATFEEADREAAEGDKATIDFVGSIDGEEFDGGKSDDFGLMLGSGQMIPGFEDQIIGHKAGEEFDIQVSFPEDYHAEALKGKEATFAIVLKKVEAQILPELNDEFAEKFGIAEGGVEALKTDVRANMKRELDQTVKAQIKQQVIDGLLEVNELDVPKSLVAGEIEVLRKQALQRFGGQVEAKNMPQLPDELFDEQAKRRVKVGLLLSEVVKGNELKADEDRVKEMIETMASAYEDPSEVVAYYNNDEKLMQQMRDLALEDQAIDFVLEKAEVSEKEQGFNDIINKNAANNA